MRFEAKHQYFKQIANGQNNFRNICRTFADRHQSKQCWEFTSLDVLHQEEETVGLSVLLLSSLDTRLKKALHEFLATAEINITDTDEVTYKTKSLRVDCVTYKVQDYFVLNTVHEDLPVFCKIISIIKIKAIWLLCAKLYFPRCFNPHLWAYHLGEADEIVILKPGMEGDYHALDAYRMDDDDEYIALHHRVWPVETSDLNQYVVA